MGKRIKKTKEVADAQMVPEVTEVAVAAAPFIVILLTAVFRSVISFFTWRWLGCLFAKKKEKTDEPSNS